MGTKSAPIFLRLLRLFMATLEWALRSFVFNRQLPAVTMLCQDEAYGDHKKQKLDLIAPDKGEGPFPILLYVHGGGWVSGDKANFVWATKSLAAAGLLVASINYRWAPEAPFEEQIRDIVQALKWVRQNSSQHGGDPEQVFLAGDSAGAHLVSWLHMAIQQTELFDELGIKSPLAKSSLSASLLFYGIYDLTTAWRLGRVMHTPIHAVLGAQPSQIPKRAELASPRAHVQENMAPLFVCSGEKDILHQQSLSLLESLQTHAVSHQAVLLSRTQYPDATHSFLNFGRRAASKRAMQEALEFISRYRR